MTIITAVCTVILAICAIEGVGVARRAANMARDSNRDITCARFSASIPAIWIADPNTHDRNGRHILYIRARWRNIGKTQARSVKLRSEIEYAKPMTARPVFAPNSGKIEFPEDMAADNHVELETSIPFSQTQVAWIVGLQAGAYVRLTAEYSDIYGRRWRHVVSGPVFVGDIDQMTGAERPAHIAVTDGGENGETLISEGPGYKDE